MMEIFDAISLPVIIAFIIGVGIDQALAFVWYRYQSRRDPMKPIARPKRGQVAIALGAAFVMAVMLYITSATNQNTRCSKQLFSTLAQEQVLSKQERDALSGLFKAVIAPPPEIIAMDPTDPRRQAYGQKIGQEYLEVTQRVAGERDKLADRRDELEATCG